MDTQSELEAVRQRADVLIRSSRAKAKRALNKAEAFQRLTDLQLRQLQQIYEMCRYSRELKLRTFRGK